MSLQIHRAERADRLVAALGALLADPLPDPFATEVVSVPTPGVERWLAQRLAGRLGVGIAGCDGVCAGVRFLSPRSLVSLLLGRETDDPWDPERLVWPLLATTAEVIRELGDLPALRSRQAPVVAAFNARFNTFNDGSAGERVAREILAITSRL